MQNNVWNVRIPDKMSIPLPPPPPVDGLSRFCVLDFPPSKIAQQLTYIDFQMFSAVRFNEFYHCAWSKKNCEQNAPNLVRLIERFNKVSQWIQTSIVRVRDLKKRTAVLARFIHIAQVRVSSRCVRSGVCRFLITARFTGV